MFNKIHHLEYGQLKFKDLGFIEQPHAHRYEIYGPFNAVCWGHLDFPIEYGKLEKDKLLIKLKDRRVLEYGMDLIGGLEILNKCWKT